MFKHQLLIILVGTLLLAACAKPPVAELNETRRIVAYAYASGASRLAAEVYQLADEALTVAERQVRDGSYQEAKLSLELARNYSNKALGLTVQRKQQLEIEMQRLADEQRQTEERVRAELQRQVRVEQARKAARIKPPQVDAAPAVPVEQKPQLVDRVEVAPGEDLANIAARAEVYQDAMLWTLIYKANRDQIKNPKEIFPGQTFLVPRDKSPAEVEAARLEAEELNLF